MSLLEAFVLLKAATLGLTGDEYADAKPELEQQGRQALRQLGHTNEELQNLDFPDHIVAQNLTLIISNPEEFARRVKLAGDSIRERN